MSDPTALPVKTLEVGAQMIADAIVIRDGASAKINALIAQRTDAITTIDQLTAQLTKSVQDVVDAKVAEAQAGSSPAPDPAPPPEPVPAPAPAPAPASLTGDTAPKGRHYRRPAK